MLNMSELFLLSVILHFPPEVYLQRGVRELALLLVRALHEREISALQFLHGGLARLNVHSSAYWEELLSSDFMFEDTPIPVTPADHPTISVYLCDLPVEIADDSVRSALKSFGDVFSFRSTVYKDFPSIRKGARVLLMSVKQPIPSLLNVLGFTCRTCPPQRHPSPEKIFAINQLSFLKRRLAAGQAGVKSEIRELETFLKQLFDQQLEGFKLRSRVKWLEEGETPSKFF